MHKAILLSAVIVTAALGMCSCGPETANGKTAVPSADTQKGKQQNTKTPASSANDIKLKDILDNMQKQLSNLKTYQARIEYLFIQDPEMLDSRILQKGMLYYAKDKRGSKIRIDFNTRKQDDGDEEKHIEQFIFDGVWLTMIDHQLEKIDYYQQTAQDKPIEVFEFISHHFPMVGFTKTDHLRKQFEITLVPEKQDKSENLFRLHLKVRKDSIYKHDYREIDFWVDKKAFLPQKMVAVSTENDIYDINLLKTRINKNFKKGRFKVETPKHFGINRKPLERK